MRNTILNWVRKNDLWIFFILVFTLMWPKSILGAAYSAGLTSHPPSTVLNVLHIFGTPLVAAIMITAVTSGRQGLKEWAARLFRWRVGWQWYLILGNLPRCLVDRLWDFFSGKRRPAGVCSSPTRVNSPDWKVISSILTGWGCLAQAASSIARMVPHTMNGRKNRKM